MEGAPSTGSSPAALSYDEPAGAANAGSSPELRADLGAMHEELGRLWSEPPLSQPKKALENYNKAVEHDPNNIAARRKPSSGLAAHCDRGSGSSGTSLAVRFW